MKWYHKLLPAFMVKDVVAEGGFEVLRRLVGEDLDRGGSLATYRKSLYVFACISKIAEKVGSIQLKMYRIVNSRGDVKEVLTHPALDLLYKLNPFQTKSEFWETTVINKKAGGDAFWYKVRNERGQVVELWNLRPDLMTIVSDPVNFIKEYKFAKNDGTIEVFAPEDIIHFKDSPDPLSQHLGLSPIKPAQNRIQTEEYATRYQRDFFLNNSRPDAVIKNPETSLTRDQKEDIKEGWERKFRGVGRSSNVAILEGGLDYQVIGITQKDMDYIEGIKATRDDILVAFKVPKPLLSIVDDVNRANSETAMYIFLSETIKPELVKMVEKINEELIYPEFGEEFYIDFVDPTPENRELTLTEYEKGLMGNWLLINEVRARENLPPVKGGWSLYTSIANQAVGGLPQNEAKALMGKVFKDSDHNKKIIEQNIVPKQYDFKGRFWLKQKFEIYETLAEGVARGLKGKTKKRKGKKTFVPLIKGEELRKAYGEMIIKKLDAQTNKMKDAVNDFAAGQAARVLAKMKGKAKGKKVSVSVDDIFDKKSETALAVKFVLPWLTEFLKLAGEDAIQMVAPAEDFNLTTPSIRKFLEKRAKEYAKETTRTTLEKLSATLSEGISAAEGITDLRQRVEAVYEEYPTYRSELIARTESTAANNSGMVEAYRQSNVANGKEWIATLDNRTREEHAAMDGEIVGLDDAFSNGLSYPSEPNCRCVVGPAFVEG